VCLLCHLELYYATRSKRCSAWAPCSLASCCSLPRLIASLMYACCDCYAYFLHHRFRRLPGYISGALLCGQRPLETYSFGPCCSESSWTLAYAATLLETLDVFEVHTIGPLVQSIVSQVSVHSTGTDRLITSVTSSRPDSPSCQACM
jgi:hypothetical protein